jgi:hypothetical protein
MTLEVIEYPTETQVAPAPAIKQSETERNHATAIPSGYLLPSDELERKR